MRYRPGLELDVLGHADLGPDPAVEQARVLAGVGDLADPEIAVALVLPAAPLGEDQAELVLALGDLERGVVPAGCRRPGCRRTGSRRGPPTRDQVFVWTHRPASHDVGRYRPGASCQRGGLTGCSRAPGASTMGQLARSSSW